MGTFTVERQIPHLIDDQVMKLSESLDSLLEFVLPACFHQPFNEAGCIRILRPEPLLHRLMTEGKSQMSLSDFRRPQEHPDLSDA